jgi:hypothetical protein
MSSKKEDSTYKKMVGLEGQMKPQKGESPI